MLGEMALESDRRRSILPFRSETSQGFHPNQAQEWNRVGGR